MWDFYYYILNTIQVSAVHTLAHTFATPLDPNRQSMFNHIAVVESDIFCWTDNMRYKGYE